jgi:RNA polymerase sigma-70 factor (ECF subfamily)
MKELYQKYFNKMKNTCRQYFPDQDDAYDVCLDIFMNKIYPQIDKIKNGVDNIEGYIRRIVKNGCVDKLRTKKPNWELAKSDYISHTYDEPTEDWFSKFDSKKLHNAIKQLTPAYRKSIELFYLKDMTHDQIAKELGITSSTSKTNLMKAKAKLKEILEPERKMALQESIKKFDQFQKLFDI